MDEDEQEHTTEITLKGDAKRARAAHEKCIKAGRRQIHHAANAGDYLLKLKAEVKHGDWETYVEQVLGIPKDIAASYMSLAKHRELWQSDDGSFLALVQDLDLTGNIRKLADHVRRKAKGKPEPKEKE